VTGKKISVLSPSLDEQERKMGDYLRNPIFFAICIVGGLVLVILFRGYVGAYFIGFGLNGLRVEQQIEQSTVEFEHGKILRELDELARETDHKRQLEMLEALKRRHDLTLPAEPDEDY
jgi:hypothetical protein